MKAHLIFPTETPHSQPEPGKQSWEGPVNWAGLDYSKCGRTDRGVSAFGQVVSLRVRSNRPLAKLESLQEMPEGASQDSSIQEEANSQDILFDPVRDELNYPALINRLLPPDIRVLAWCPAPSPSFSARFSCRERRYRYFFTQPAFLPTPSSNSSSAHFSIDAMREAASHLVGSHDFRNFCKIDASKQISSFVRRITHASIDEVANVDIPSFPESSGRGDRTKVYALSLHGSAFLWHQVRCIMAVLFLVGQHLEQPSVIRELLATSSDSSKPIGRPHYEMADDKPLVLWDCIYPVDATGEIPPVGWQPSDGTPMKDSLKWITSHMQTNGHEAVWGQKGLFNNLWSQWRGRKMDELLAAALMDRFSSFADQGSSFVESSSTKIFDGGDSSRLVGRYVPLLQRHRLEAPEVLNAKWLAKKGLDPSHVRSADEDADE